MQLLQSPSSQASPYPKVNKKKAPRRPSKDEASTTDCAVCGDKASKYRYSHYGATSCFSCRAFFRRTVKKSKHEIFYCSSGNCQIDAVTRKKCPYCRYEISFILKRRNQDINIKEVQIQIGFFTYTMEQQTWRQINSFYLFRPITAAADTQLTIEIACTL